MSCDKYSDWTILYLYNELDHEDKKTFERHLKKCSNCREEIYNLQQSKNLYRSVSQIDISNDRYQQLFHSKSLQKKYINISFTELIEAIRNFIYGRWRFILLPMTAILLLVLTFTLQDIKTDRDDSLTSDPSLLKWSINIEDSLNAIDIKIAQLQLENSISNGDSIFENDIDITSLSNETDKKLAQIEEDLADLVFDLKNLKF